MPNFCPNCAATLDPDAKFCPSCSSPISPPTYQGAPGMSYGAGMAPGMQRGGSGFNMAGAMTGAKVDQLTWASVLALFWAAWFFSQMAGTGGIVDMGMAAGAGRGAGGDSDTAAIFFLISHAFSVLAFAVMAIVAYGVLAKKRWAHGLYMMAVGPLALIWLILGLVTFFTSGSKPAGIVIVVILGMITGLGLFGLLALMIMKNKNQFVN